MTNLLTRQVGDRVFAIGYEDEEARSWAESQLERDIEQYEEDTRLAGLSIQYIASEMANSVRTQCPHCHSYNTVEKVDRTRQEESRSVRLPNMTVAWPYRECQSCHNQFGQPNVGTHDFMELAEHRKFAAEQRLKEVI